MRLLNRTQWTSTASVEQDVATETAMFVDKQDTWVGTAPREAAREAMVVTRAEAERANSSSKEDEPATTEEARMEETKEPAEAQEPTKMKCCSSA